MRRIKFLSVFVLLALLLSAGPGAVMGQNHPPFPARQSEPTTGALQVCSAEVDPPDGEERPYLQTTVPLTEDEPLFETLRQSRGSQIFEQASAERFGSPLWDQATLATYQNTDVQALLVPIESGESSDVRFLVTYYSEQAGPIRTVIFEISPAPTLAAEHDPKYPSVPVTFSGVISYYTPDGRLLASATFEENQLISTKQGYSPTNIGRAPGLQAPTAGFWDCFGQCLDSCWKALPFWLQLACGASCGACMWGGNIPACAVCASCLAGAAIPCITCCAEHGIPEFCRCD